MGDADRCPSKATLEAFVVGDVAADDGTHADDQLADLPAPPDEMMDTADDVSASAALVRRVLKQVREHFSDQTWSAFWRTAVDAQPAADVAEELSMSAVAVRVAKSRILQRLRDDLGEIS